MEHKKYLSIERLKNNYTDGFQKGDLIIIQEKVGFQTILQKNDVISARKADSFRFFKFDMSDGLSIMRDVGLDAF